MLPSSMEMEIKRGNQGGGLANQNLLQENVHTVSGGREERDSLFILCKSALKLTFRER